MKKEDLMKIEGMTDAIAEAVAKASAEELKEFIPKTRFDEVNEAKKNAEELVKARDKQLEDLKKSTGNSEELQNQISQLQAENKKIAAEKEAEIKRIQVNNAVALALKDAGAKNVTAITALLKDLDKAELDENGIVKGLADQIKEIQKSDSYLFETKADPQRKNPKGFTPADGKTDPPGTVTKEQFERMGYKQRVELFNTNRDLYESLVGTNNQ